MRVRGEGFTLTLDDFEAWCADASTSLTFDEWLDAKLDAQEAEQARRAAQPKVRSRTQREILPGDITYVDAREGSAYYACSVMARSPDVFCKRSDLVPPGSEGKPRVRVRAKEVGFDGLTLRQPGDEFDWPTWNEGDELPFWMERVE